MSETAKTEQTIIGESTQIQDLRDHISRVAVINRPVLVIGERGSGKEMVAQRLHFLSGRWQEPLLSVNCGAFAEELLDSALFGHEAGAFTGARQRYVGLFERAHGGTLFLDEIGNMGTRMQQKLLRVIEYGMFERLGGRSAIAVDVRVVAATHANLPGRVTEGSFRADLLDRLSFEVIQVPPLRVRENDCFILAEFFARRMVAELGGSFFGGFSADAYQQMSRYSWPGNIRELKNVIERAVCRSEDPTLEIDQLVMDPFASRWLDVAASNERLSATIATKERQESASAKKIQDLDDDLFDHLPKLRQAHAEHIVASGDFYQGMALFSKHILEMALEKNRYQQKQAAAALGLRYSQFRGLCRKYAIQSKRELIDKKQQ